jgi:hypothetical protein
VPATGFSRTFLTISKEPSQRNHIGSILNWHLRGGVVVPVVISIGVYDPTMPQ